MSGAQIEARFRGRLGGFALDVAFDAPTRGITMLFGPSGCGKTLTLRAIAGLQRFASGRFSLDGDVWQDETQFRPPHQRPVGYVFQEASLFPHLSVRKNLQFGMPKGALAIRFDDVVTLLGLAKLLERAPHALSGGERQRVAIGRALLSQPKLLLMDEPLSALDATTKLEIMPYLEQLHLALALPIICVTHDMAEVQRLADHLVLMEAGRVTASGSLGQLQSDPVLPLMLARDAAVTLDAVVQSYDATFGMAQVQLEGGTFLVPCPASAPGALHRLRIFAGDVSLALERPQSSTITNILPARILSAAPSASHEITVILGLGAAGTGAKVLARVTRRSWEALSLHEGLDVFSQIKAVALIKQTHG